MNGGPQSNMYKLIEKHFTTRADGFDATTMDQIIGGQSLMFQLNYTFDFNCIFTMKYSGGY
jgi:hypothetical protein